MKHSKMAIREREAAAVRLRRGGATYELIAQTLGYSCRSSAYRAVDRALARVTDTEATLLLKLELERLDEMFRALWPQAMRGDRRAIDRILAIMDRRARYLGLHSFQTRDGEDRANLQHVVAALADLRAPRNAALSGENDG